MSLDERISYAYEYLVAKTFSISAKYPNYKNSIKVKPSEYTSYCTIEQEVRIKSLVDKIKKDTSHTTVKIRQTLKYIEYITSQNAENADRLSESYIEYQPANSAILNGLTESEKLVASFPPSFFDIQIGLNKKDDAKKELIQFERMSSGERQFLFYMSTILYHIMNLDSVVDGEESVHYNYVNLILEEVELYFHPEYQRRFISKLIRYLDANRYKNIKYFNIIIVTHSPFVLSDIPKDNIMFLKDGCQTDNSSVNFDTMGANIHDLLRYSFFLDDGLMGEWGKAQIIKIADILSQDSIHSEIWSKEEIFYLINNIGEPIIKDRLLSMFNQKWPDKTFIEEQIAKLQKQL